MHGLTGFQRDILYCIAATDNPYGLEIKRQLEKQTSEDVNHGRLYPNLDSLAEQDLINIESKDDRTNLYTLSDSGIETIKKRREWENSMLNDIDIIG